MDNIIRQEAEKARPFIEAALEYSGGTHTFGDVVGALVSGEMQLWATDSAAVVTELQMFPQYRACNFFLAGGDMNQLAHFQRVIGEWAKAQGCQRLTITGRRGWERTFLKDEGYTPKWTTFSKEL
jgi:hypothetical protein